MSEVNIHSGWTLSGAKHSLSAVDGDLKTFPEDFVVTELHYCHDNPADEFFCQRLQTGSSPLVGFDSLTRLKLAQNPCVKLNDDLQQTVGSLDEILTPSIMDALHSLNECVLKNKEVVDVDGITFTCSLSKERRKLLHLIIRESFPFLCTNVTMHELECTIKIFPDRTFINFLDLGISLEELMRLYLLKNNGPSHSDASLGVCVGASLSREQRTSVYKILCSRCPSLDSKTVDVPTGEDVVYSL